MIRTTQTSCRRELAPNTLILTLAILGVLALPEVFHYFGFASSLVFGTTLICSCFYLYSKFCNSRVLSVIKIGKLNTYIFFIVFFLGILLHLIIASLFSDVNFIKALSSLFLLGIMLLAAIKLSGLLTFVPDIKLDKAIYMAFICMTCFALAAILGLNISGAIPRIKPVFPFTEPSHFALSFIPLLIYQSTNPNRKVRFSFLGVGFISVIFLQNLTMVVGCLITLLVSMRVKTLLIFGLCIVVFFSSVSVDLAYYLDRLNFANGSDNLSALAYMQGWQLIFEALQNSNGWGLGFQQLGLTSTNVDAASQLYYILGFNMNLQDGGFTFSKIVSEFGVFGLFIVLFFLIRIFKAIKLLRAVALGTTKASMAVVLASSFVVSFLMELLIRGNGYFTPTFFATLASVIFLINQEKSLKINKV